ncbi:unnamed protein product [Lactuca virosa]|uniref:Uncharacterized protein n=1 Tax=Lactuca virosa TaxID=75947 RepID=A0AAU9ME05_9ASTR|nr:unnamed protein product [Lactuca virosa]
MKTQLESCSFFFVFHFCEKPPPRGGGVAAVVHRTPPRTTFSSPFLPISNNSNHLPSTAIATTPFLLLLAILERPRGSSRLHRLHQSLPANCSLKWLKEILCPFPFTLHHSFTLIQF